MSWEFSTTPVNVAGLKPTAILRIDSTKVDKTKLATLESKLYGGENSEASIPLPDEIKQNKKSKWNFGTHFWVPF